MTTVPMPLQVLLIGGGAREHAIAQFVSRSPLLGTLYASHTENPGIAALAKPVDVPVSIREIYRLQQFIAKHRIGLVIIGPEDPLAEGYVDKLSSPSCMVFGPTQAGAQLEADKAWAKQLMRGASIPTGDARVFTSADAARQYVESREREEPLLAQLLELADRYRDPADRRKFIAQQIEGSKELRAIYAATREDMPVIKASGLAKGKGVVLPKTLNEAIWAIDQIMVRKVFGEAGNKLVIEERLAGPEASVLAMTDGQTIVVFPPAQDHKRLLDNDQGPNTGGMGAFCPTNALTPELMGEVDEHVLVPTIDALAREGIVYRGVLFAGLMLTRGGPRVLEFNCRFGDPECQTILPRLKTDLLWLIVASCQGTLHECDVEWDARATCCVVLAAANYPEKPKTGDAIVGIEEAMALPDTFVFHAGTKREASTGRIVTNGGRVLSVVGMGETLAQARERAYAGVAKIHFAGMQYRRDIAAHA